MKHEKLADALGEISDRHIAEAVKKKTPLPLIAATAALVALAVGLGAILHPFVSTPSAIDHSILAPHLVSAAEYPTLHPYPVEYSSAAHDLWWEQQRALHDQPEGYADSLESYWGALLCKLMEDSGDENFACSPVNIYMALAMLTETAGGESRQQLLELLNADSIEALREQAGHVWKAHYNNDGLSTSILANSLWLEEGYTYDQKTVKLLADSYYGSTFLGDLGAEEMNRALQAWLDEQTGGLLTGQAEEIELDPESVLALASTVYYQVQWRDEFREEGNTTATFHGAKRNTEETFMNRSGSDTYFWSDNFGAVYLQLEDGSRMWLVLPDEGVTPVQLLQSGEVTDFLAQHPAWADTTWEDQKHLIVNLSVPKFDVSSSLDLCDKLKELGVMNIFGSSADFTPIMPESDGCFIGQINHAARVGIDEKGVTAAAFTVIGYCGASMPPTEEVDFILDRPFLFVIESQDGLPLFAGIVNQP